ncbi:MAG TPA: FAD-binding oxidoreductase [Vicinamibacterales bacterium]|nr:FAD-binding oxidoreductase [Vicinamibacterales bacterium]
MPTLPIREAVAATPRAHIIKLDLQGNTFPYLAGQAAYLQPQGVEKRRPYSIASAPEETAQHGLIEFLVQTASNGSSGLTPEQIRPGTPVVLEGPLGSFTFPAHPKEHRFVFIAGGTGIAPLRSMLWHALLTERDGHVALVYSVRSPEEFAYMQEFQRLEDEGRIDFRHTVTRAATEGWSGRQGRIDVRCFDGLIDPGKTLCFVCGPSALIGEIRPQLMELGVSEDQIRIENWGS